MKWIKEIPILGKKELRMASVHQKELISLQATTTTVFWVNNNNTSTITLILKVFTVVSKGIQALLKP